MSGKLSLAVVALSATLLVVPAVAQEPEGSSGHMDSPKEIAPRQLAPDTAKKTEAPPAAADTTHAAAEEPPSTETHHKRSKKAAKPAANDTAVTKVEPR